MAFRWVYIGSGNIAERTAADITRGEHEIVAVFGRNKRTAAAFAKKYGAAVYDDPKAAIAHPGADAVYIATPHTSHAAYACLALSMGKPVLCEKPVGISSAEVETMLRCAKEHDVYFAEAMWTWFSDVAQTVKRWVQDGSIGKPLHAKLCYSFPGLLQPRTSRLRMPETAGGALLDIGIYPITYCYNLFGVPDTIRCTGKLRDGIDTEEHITLQYGVLSCDLFFGLTGLRESCLIEGTKGSIQLPVLFHAANRATLKTDNGKTVFRGRTDYLTQFDRVAADIRAGRKEPLYVPHEATKACMRIMDECRRQLALRYPFENDN